MPSHNSFQGTFSLMISSKDHWEIAIFCLHWPAFHNIVTWFRGYLNTMTLIKAISWSGCALMDSGDSLKLMDICQWVQMEKLLLLVGEIKNNSGFCFWKKHMQNAMETIIILVGDNRLKQSKTLLEPLASSSIIRRFPWVRFGISWWKPIKINSWWQQEPKWKAQTISKKDTQRELLQKESF